MRRGLLIAGATLALLIACSKRETPPDLTVPAPDSGRHSVAVSVCERWLKVDDLAGILRSPITGTQALPGDGQTCSFVTAGFAVITVAVRPGVGRTTVDTWASGRMPLQGTSLRGVGDKALWIDALHEVIAEKDALLCDIQVRSDASDLAQGPATLPNSIGALCNKIFAASLRP